MWEIITNIVVAIGAVLIFMKIVDFLNEASLTLKLPKAYEQPDFFKNVIFKTDINYKIVSITLNGLTQNYKEDVEILGENSFKIIHLIQDDTICVILSHKNSREFKQESIYGVKKEMIVNNIIKLS